MHVKGMEPMHDFIGRQVIYDFPFYEYIVAKLALFTHAGSLVVVRYVNLVFWVMMMVAGGFIAEGYAAGNRFYFWALATVSPLFLHYFATPMPDVMALALSAAALAMLLDPNEDTRLHLAWPALLLVIAALIKSPVPYVLLVYYFVRRTLNRHEGGDAPFSARNRVIYAVALIGAVGAELFRRYYMGTNVDGFAQTPSWYFGTLELRASAEFWRVIWLRLAEAQPYAPMAYLLVIVMVVYAVRHGKGALRVLAPFVVAFLAGWLTFSNVYVMHAYYQLPVTFLLFIAAAVSIGALVNRAEEKTAAKGKSDFSWRMATISLILGATPVLMIFGDKMSIYQSIGIADSARFAFLNFDHFLWVDDEDEGPAVGGVVGTPFTWVTTQEFEQNCERYVNENRAIMVKMLSECLIRNRHRASTYIEDGGFQVFVRAAPTSAAQGGNTP